MSDSPSLRPFLFISGAPRSGTTFISDWITETEDAYICHEVLPQLTGLNVPEMWKYLESCAKTSEDRMQKPGQLEFLKWRERRRPFAPSVLGLKEPVTWTTDEPPEALVSLLSNSQSRCIILVRHPYDLVISGIRRGSGTRNWPGYTIEEHCRFWMQATSLLDWLRRSSIPVLVLPWEDLILVSEASKESLETFIGFPLPEFTGFERDPSQLDFYRQTVSRTHGIRDLRHQAELSDSERKAIFKLVGSLAEEFGYCLNEPRDFDEGRSDRGLPNKPRAHC